MGRKAMHAVGYAAVESGAPLVRWEFERRDAGPQDVVLDILYCGMCHTDKHMVDNDWGRTMYPLVPGHEIVGRVTEIGFEVEKFAVGDLVAVGCLVDSCRICRYCRADLENLCDV